MKSEFYVYDPSVLYRAHRLEMEQTLREGMLIRQAIVNSHVNAFLVRLSCGKKAAA
ncbi:MAG TPA: hypothetical protein VNT01_02890 [Symbiobacteriaceae bacterium]|nr:hypothetical protein [Symbiobacteriaceae bacterium]